MMAGATSRTPDSAFEIGPSAAPTARRTAIIRAVMEPKVPPRSREFLTELKRPSPQNRIDDPVVHALCDLVSIVNGRARYWPVLTLSGLF
jgi:hypothetical protein